MILLRHGQTEFNVVYKATGVDPGIADPPVTAVGHAQAVDAAVALAALAEQTPPLRRIIASPYRRALQTAAIVAAELALPVIVEPLVRERAAFSCDVGTPRAQLVDEWPAFDFMRVTEETWWHPFEDIGPESEAAVRSRGDAFVTAMAGDGDWDTAIVVSHREFIRPLIGEILANGDWRKFHRPETE